MAERNRPGNSRFKQQTLPAWKPILTPRTVLPTFFVLGTIFLAFGVALYVASEDVKEQVWEYTNCYQNNTNQTCANLLANPALGYTNTSQPTKRCRCEVVVDLTKGFDSSSTFLYYSLDSFYQNHRRYVKSRWDPQLRSDELKGGVDCDPLTKDAGGAPYLPCGLVANSLFNDTIRMYQCLTDNCAARAPIALAGNKISWASDRDHKFKNPTGDEGLCTYGPWQSSAKPANWPVSLCRLGAPMNSSAGEYNPWSSDFGSSGRGLENEDLIVWMRTAALPNFRKLYRRVESNIPNGRYVFSIDYNYPVTSFGGSKLIVLSTTSWIGGKNLFLGVCYIVVACLAIGVVVFFVIFQRVRPRHMADDRFLKWDRD